MKALFFSLAVVTGCGGAPAPVEARPAATRETAATPPSDSVEPSGAPREATEAEPVQLGPTGRLRVVVRGIVGNEPARCGNVLDPWAEDEELAGIVILRDGGSEARVQNTATTEWRDVIAGRVEVTVELPDGNPWVRDRGRRTTTVEVAAGADETLRVDIKRRYVRIVPIYGATQVTGMTARLTNTTTQLEGRPGCDYYPLSIGEHSIDIETPAHGAQRRQIRVTDHGPYDILVDLSGVD